MQLTSSDETDLLMPLYAGVHDQGAWLTFLQRIQRRTGADYVSLIFAQGDTPIHLAKEVFVGRDLRAEARALGLDAIYEKDRLPYDRLRPGRVYQSTEFVEDDPQFTEFHEEFAQKLGLTDERIVRIKEQEGTSAWLMLVRFSGFFSAADGALMAAVAPHVAIALRNFVVTERHRVQSAASREGLARAGVGWIALGRDTRILDFDSNLAPLLARLHGSEQLIGERLHVDAPHNRQIVAQLANEFARNSAAMPRAVILSEDLGLDALLVPMSERPEAALSLPVMLVFCRVQRTPESDRKAILSTLYGLSRREAEFALALGDGKSISEAAVAMGWTEETARSYSKRVYAKMGLRSQSDLVRELFLSSARLA